MSSAAPQASGRAWAWCRAACEIAGGLAVLAGLAWFAAWETGLAYLVVAVVKRRPDVALAGAGGLALLAWKVARGLRGRCQIEGAEKEAAPRPGAGPKGEPIPDGAASYTHELEPPAGGVNSRHPGEPCHLPMAITTPRQGQNCPRRMARKG